MYMVKRRLRQKNLNPTLLAHGKNHSSDALGSITMINPKDVPPKTIWVNIDGIGWFIAARLKEEGFPVIEFPLHEEQALHKYLDCAEPEPSPLPNKDVQ